MRISLLLTVRPPISPPALFLKKLFLCGMVALLWIGPVRASTIIKDTFTGLNGTRLPAHAPDINLPGGRYVEVDSGGVPYGDFIENNMVAASFGTYAMVSISSHGSYTEAKGMVTVSIDLSVGNLIADSFSRGVMLGFTVGTTVPQDFGGMANVAGIIVRPGGSVYLERVGRVLVKLGEAPPGFTNSGSYTLSYGVNLTTGELSNIVFGKTAYAVPPGTGNIFGGSAPTAFGFAVSSAAALTSATVDNLTLVDPATP